MCFFRSLLEEYERNMTGKTANKLRWKTCVSLVDEGLRAAVGKMYVLKHFKEPSKLDMIEMVKYIREEFAKIIDQVVTYSVISSPSPEAFASYFSILQSLDAKNYNYCAISFFICFQRVVSSGFKCRLTERHK